MTPDSFERLIFKMCLETIYLIYTYKKDLALSKLQNLIGQKPNSNQTKAYQDQ